MEGKYADAIRESSSAMVEVQRPIRVLDAVEWDDGVRAAFLAAGGRELPRIDRAYCERQRPLRFDPAAKQEELRDLEQAVGRRLGPSDPVATLLLRMTDEYRRVVDMLVARGTREFGDRSWGLYGAATDHAPAGTPDLGKLAEELVRTLDRIADHSPANPERSYSGSAPTEMGRKDRIYATDPCRSPE